jgi:hypothetical protein
MEAEADQIRTIACILESRGYNDIQIYRDLAGQMRVIGGNYSV